MAKKSEAAFSVKVQNFIRSRGHIVIKQHGNEFSQPFVPDLLCCINGFFVAIELKTTTDLSPGQLEFLKRIVVWGKGIAFMLKNDEMWETKLTILLNKLEKVQNVNNPELPN